MLSNIFLKLNYFTRIVGMAKFHDEFHAIKKSRYPVWEIVCLPNKLFPVQNTSTVFRKKNFVKKSYSLPIVTRQWEVVN